MQRIRTSHTLKQQHCTTPLRLALFVALNSTAVHECESLQHSTDRPRFRFLLLTSVNTYKSLPNTVQRRHVSLSITRLPAQDEQCLRSR